MLVNLFRMLSRLPLPALHALGSALGWTVYLASPAYRRRLRENIHRAGYPQHRHAAIGEAGKSILELPFIWCADPARVLATADIENWPLLQEALDSGGGVIMLTPHLGCFELIAQVVATRIPFTVLYRPPRKAALKPLMEDARARHNLLLAPANLSGVRALLKTLRKGGAIGLLPDQVPQHGEGVWANFFGKPAYTMTLPGKLQRMSNAPLIVCHAERKPHGRGYLIRFTRHDQPLGESAEQQARAINAAMEEVIGLCPAQYFWSYNRYKTPPGVQPPDVASPGTTPRNAASPGSAQ